VANVDLQVVNPKKTDVTVNAHVAKANRITKLTIDNTTADVYGFLAAGCAVTSIAGSATYEQREKEGFMLEILQQDVQ
jgi:hypothetical protein